MNAIRGEHCLFRIFAVMRVGIFFVARVMKLRMLVGLAGSIAVGAEAQSVLFDFENAPPNHAVPFNLTVGGITASFSKTGLGGFYVDLPQNTIGVLPAGFSGLCLNPTSTSGAELDIGFSVPLTDFAILYAAQELACDQSATMKVTAYLNGALAGSATTNATALCPCTWQSQTLAFSSAQGFNSVVVQWVAPGPGCQDYGPIFVADNMVATPAPPPIVLTNPTSLPGGGFQFRFTNTPGRSFTVFGITNLSVPFSNWTALSGLTETAPGQFQFTDSQATNHETRFYRVRAP
jgi:hypothetical protein